MKAKSTCFLFVLLPVACADVTVGSSSDPIINGTLDSGDPAVVYVKLKTSGGTWLGSCTGSLISDHVVMTAAHCASGESGESRWDVLFGSDAEDPDYTRNVTVASVHEDYDNVYLTNDIALLLMTSERPSSISPLPINRTTLTSGFEGDSVRLVGFGLTESGTTDDRKRQVTSTLEDYDYWDIYFGSASANICQGDSGGPNFMTIDGEEVVAGVSSFTTSEDCDTLSGGTRVDSYLDFIDDFVDAQGDAECGSDGFCASGCGSVDLDCPCDDDDGFCTTACDDLDDDDDCPNGCADNGVCVESGCPEPDPDCSDVEECVEDGVCDASCDPRDSDCPLGEVGETCSEGEECESGLCLPATDDGTITFCSGECDPSGDDCPDAMVCAAATGGLYVCVYEEPSPGALGAACTGPSECVSEMCIEVGGESICTSLCVPDEDPCRQGYECVATTGAESVCVPETVEDGGGDGGGDDDPPSLCSLQPRGGFPGGALAMLALSWLVLTGRRATI